MKIDINDKLLNDIQYYVDYNNLGNVNDFINFLIKKAFNIEKYGETPFQIIEKQKENNKDDNKIENKIIEDTKIEKKQIEKKNRIRIIKND